MDHNNKHLLPGFQFPAAFAGLQNAGASSLISTLSHLSGLSAPMLQPTLSTAELAQWAAAQQAAAMFGPMYAKSLEIAQQNLQSAVNGTTSSTIFPALMKQVTATKVVSPRKEPVDSPLAPEPLSNASSSHQSTSTPQEIDVGMVSTTSQTHAFDLSAKTTSPAVKLNEHSLLCEPSTSTSFNSLLTGSLSSNFNNLMAKPLPTGLSSLTQGTTTLTKEDGEELDPSEFLAVSLFASAKPPDIAAKGKLASFLTSTASAIPTTSTVKRHEQEENDHDVDKMFDFNPTERDEASPAFGLFSSTNDGGLSPVQFTPPDSPTHASQDDDVAVPMVFSARPTPASTPFLPAPAPTPAPMQKQQPMHVPPIQRPRTEYDPFKIPTVTSVKTVRKEPFQARPIIKSNKLKVPVYKQKRLANYRCDDNVKQESTGDAYSFSDEEEHSIAKMEPKDRLDAEVREKLSRIAGQGGDNKNKNVYVPGVGFAVPQEQPPQDLWRNVVLKKRPLENRPLVPSANLLPASVHAEAARLAEPEIVTLAESIRRRKKARYVCPFIKTEPTTSTECAKEDGADERIAEMKKELEAQPKLPKLIIKIPKKSEERVEKKKKKKKRKREEDDSDWEGSRKNKKHKKRRTSENRRNSGYEVRMVDSFNQPFKQPIEDIKDIKSVVKEERHEAPINFKKKRLLQDWQDQQGLQNNKSVENGERKYNGVKGYTSLKKFNFADFNTDAINQRLSKFCQADGHITKGTFVVNKSELFRDDCALWKVDNPNMLQKFPPRIDPTTKNVTYKSSSTYSGWCEQISSGYYKVAVRFIKQTRSESIVEPEIPLSDLFPAMTSEISDNNGFIPVEEELPVDQNDHMMLLRDQRRMDLIFLTRVIVDHALTLEHLQQLKEKTDWTFLKALAGVQKLNNESIEKIRLNSSMRTEMEDTLKEYIKLCVADLDSKTFLCKLCQACKYEKRPVEKVIQLLGRTPYDPDTLLPKDPPKVEMSDDDDEPQELLPATELFMCNSCATAAQYFHKCHHMLFHLLVSSENKLESLGTLHSEYKPELIVEQAKKLRTWQSKVFAEILEMWKKIETMPVATMSAPSAP